MSHLCKINSQFSHRLDNQAVKVAAYGEVFTPPKAVNQLLDLLDDDAWSNPQTAFVEPACGDGAFVTVILQRRMEALAKADRTQYEIVATAVCTLWAIDIQDNNVNECRANAVRAVLQYLYPEPITCDVIDFEFIAGIAAAIKHHIRVGDGLQFKPKEKNTYLMLPREEQIRTANRQLTILRVLLSGELHQSWLAGIFCPTATSHQQ